MALSLTSSSAAQRKEQDPHRKYQQRRFDGSEYSEYERCNRLNSVRAGFFEGVYGVQPEYKRQQKRPQKRKCDQKQPSKHAGYTCLYHIYHPHKAQKRCHNGYYAELQSGRIVVACVFGGNFSRRLPFFCRQARICCPSRKLFALLSLPVSFAYRPDFPPARKYRLWHCPVFRASFRRRQVFPRIRGRLPSRLRYLSRNIYILFFTLLSLFRIFLLNYRFRF